MRRILATITATLSVLACGSNTTTPTTPSPSDPPATSRTAAFTVTFTENPVQFRSAGCNASQPQGWYTTARLQETAGVNFTPGTLIQKIDGNVSSLLAESFNSRFGACTGSSFTDGVIPASGAACGSVGICTSSTFTTYQFQISGTDANGHAVTFDSPVLQLGTRPAGQSIPLRESSATLTAPTPIPPVR